MQQPIVTLRDVIASDLPIFFENQLDPESNHMAAFGADDPSDREAFDKRWVRILSDDSIIRKTIVYEGEVAGNVSRFDMFGETTIGYWLGKNYWGKGIATAAVKAFVMQLNERPLYARVAFDNIGSRRVLEKAGFVKIGEDTGYANARRAEIVEYIMILR